MQGNTLFWNTAYLPKITGTAPMGCVMKIRQLLLDARHVGIELQQLDKHVGLIRWCRKPLIKYIETTTICIIFFASPKTWITVAVLHALLGSEDPLDFFCCNSTTWIKPVTRLQPTDMCSWHRNQAKEELFVCFKLMGLELKITNRFMCYGYAHRYPFMSFCIIYLFHEYPFGCQWLTPNLHQTVDIMSTILPIRMVCRITTHVDVYRSPWGYITPEIAGKFPGFGMLCGQADKIPCYQWVLKHLE